MFIWLMNFYFAYECLLTYLCVCARARARTRAVRARYAHALCALWARPRIEGTRKAAASVHKLWALPRIAVSYTHLTLPTILLV